MRVSPPRQLQAGAAGAPVGEHAGAHRVGAVMADKPPVLIGDHRPEVDSCDAIRAADGQGCVGQSWHRTLLQKSKERGTQDSGHPSTILLNNNNDLEQHQASNWDEARAEIPAGVPTGGQVRQVLEETLSPDSG